MGWAYAGQWGPLEFIKQNPTTEKIGPPSTVTVYELDGTTVADLFTDETAGTSLGNPLPTGVAEDAPGLSATGNAKFFAFPRKYKIVVDGVTFTIQVLPDPGDMGPPGSINAFFDPVSGTYPTRSSVTTNPNQSVWYFGPNDNLVAAGGGYATVIDLAVGY